MTISTRFKPPSRYENLAAILRDLDVLGVLYRLVNGEFRVYDPQGRLTAEMKTGIDVCRHALTIQLRREMGLCVSCGLEPARHLDMTGFAGRIGTSKGHIRVLAPAHIRARYPPLWCPACWQAGRWKDDPFALPADVPPLQIEENGADGDFAKREAEVENA